MNPAVLQLLWDYGFSIYMRSQEDLYLYYTQGANQIAYLGYRPAGGFTISTVHRPNMRTGTGFQIHSPLSFYEVTKERLEDGFWTYPNFPITDSDRASVYKYPSVSHWLKSDRFLSRPLHLMERQAA